jgi:hypothetical protein
MVGMDGCPGGVRINIFAPTLRRYKMFHDTDDLARVDKLKRARRLGQKKRHIKRQAKLQRDIFYSTDHLVEQDQPHRLLKKSAMSCANPNCMSCRNPRKIFELPTMQERKFDQDGLHHPYDTIPEDEDG